MDNEHRLKISDSFQIISDNEHKLKIGDSFQIISEEEYNKLPTYIDCCHKKNFGICNLNVHFNKIYKVNSFNYFWSVIGPYSEKIIWAPWLIKKTAKQLEFDYDS